MDPKEIWKTALGELEVTLTKANFKTWFKNTSLIEAKDGVFTIAVPNVFTREWLKTKYHQQITESLEHVAGPVKKLKYQVGLHLTPSENERVEEFMVKSGLEEKEKPARNGTLNPRYVFENFVVGNSNKLAHAACQAVAKSPGKTYNPLFIYGGVGLGKTHLMQALGNEILKKYPPKKVIYLACESFVNDFIKAISTGDTNRFKNNYRNVDVLLIDDIQFLAGKEGTQEEFFHTFNALHQKDKQIVISSDRPPKAIPTLEERLRSRFEGGMIVDIQPPDLETRVAILESKSKEKGFVLPQEVLSYIAKNVPYNIREMEGALNRVIAYCELNNINPTLEAASSLLSSLITIPKRRSINAEQIIKIVSSFYNLKVSDITGKKRNKEFVAPRQIIMYLLREELGQSFPKIAEILGGKDHTTIMYGFQKIAQQISENENLRREINLIRERLYS